MLYCSNSHIFYVYSSNVLDQMIFLMLSVSGIHLCLFPYLSLILLTVVDKSNINFLSVCSLHCPGQELFPYLLCISAQLVELVVDGFFLPS